MARCGRGQGLVGWLLVGCLAGGAGFAEGAGVVTHGNLRWRAPDPAVWSRSDSDGWVIYRARVPEGQYATLRIPPGEALDGDLAPRLDTWLQRDLRGSRRTFDPGPARSRSPQGAELLERMVFAGGDHGASFLLYRAAQAGDRFELVAFAASSEGLFRQHLDAVKGLFDSLEFLNLPPAPTAAAATEEDERAFRARDITEDGWLDGTETRGVETYDTDGDGEITRAEFLAGRARERGETPAPTAPVPAPPVAAPPPAAPPVVAPPAEAPPAPPAPGPRALPAGRAGLEGLYFWLTTSMFGGNLSISYHHCYFLPNGRAYLGVPPGGLEQFDFDRLAQSHPEQTGYYAVVGTTLHFEPLRGDPESWTFEPNEEGGYDLDGYFAKRVGSFPANTRLDAWYEAAGAVVGGGVGVFSSRQIQLQADGSYRASAFGGVTTGDATGQSEAKEAGRYELSGNTLLLTSAAGRRLALTAYPYPEENESPPKRIGIDESLYRLLPR